MSIELIIRKSTTIRTSKSRTCAPELFFTTNIHRTILIIVLLLMANFKHSSSTLKNNRFLGQRSESYDLGKMHSCGGKLLKGLGQYLHTTLLEQSLT